VDHEGNREPGWYPDPLGERRRRWWDGQRWLPPLPGDEVSRRTFANIAFSESSDAINAALMFLSGLCAGVMCLVVLFLDVVHRRSYPNLLPLLLIGIPVLVAGQVWIIALINARGDRRTYTALFRGVPSWLGVTTCVLVAFGAVNVVPTFFSGKNHPTAGHPAGMLLVFYSLHWGNEAAEHYRRRSAATS